MPKYILALDQGTSSSRAILFDHDGAPVAQASLEFPQIYPQPGWVSHDPEAIWSSQLEAAKQRARSMRGRRAEDIAAIGITNQRETTVVWDRATGRAINDAVVWQCRRTAGICEDLRARGLEPEVRGAHRPAHRRLLLRHEGALAARQRGDGMQQRAEARRAGVRHRRLVADPQAHRRPRARHRRDERVADDALQPRATATGTTRMLERAEHPAAMLPTVVDSSGVVAETDAAIFGAPIPIAGIAGDQQAALFGQGCFEAGSAKNTYGTGCFILQHTGARPVFSQNGLLTTVASRIGGKQQFARRRQHLHRRRGGAVAARRARHHQDRGRERGARARPCRRATACTSCRRSPASARRTGTCTRAARSSASRAARRRRTSRARRSSRSRCRRSTSSS